MKWGCKASLAKRPQPSHAMPDRSPPCPITRSRPACLSCARNADHSSHSHLGLQLSELLLLVILLNAQRRLALGLRAGGLRQAADLVADGDGPGVEHLLVELFLLKLGEFFVQLVIVDGGGDDAACYRFGDFVADGMLFTEIFPVVFVSNSMAQTGEGRKQGGATNITLSTLSIVRPAWMCFIAAPAFFMASRVSLLMFAVSILYTSRSSVMICDCVCSSECSNCFFRLSAAFAAVPQHTLVPVP